MAGRLILHGLSADFVWSGHPGVPERAGLCSPINTQLVAGSGLNRGLNAQIEAYSRAADMFQGNINWEIQGGDFQATEKTAATPQSNRELPVPPSRSTETGILAKATVGKGGPLLRLASHDIITINVH
ncbi:hypothetical protein hamaS1_26670 [Moorella sp. Hama-1]|nr:hypothetical protein hamaS1_26670 [Moorella sp. Hama-1]